jgi:hypothetical protein
MKHACVVKMYFRHSSKTLLSLPNLTSLATAPTYALTHSSGEMDFHAPRCCSGLYVASGTLTSNVLPKGAGSGKRLDINSSILFVSTGIWLRGENIGLMFKKFTAHAYWRTPPLIAFAKASGWKLASDPPWSTPIASCATLRCLRIVCIRKNSSSNITSSSRNSEQQKQRP